MSLDVLEKVAEIVSAIGVLVTLVYLVVQIRQSATIGKANIRQQLAEQQIGMLRAVALDPTLRVASLKMFQGCTREELTEDEQTALFHHVASSLRLQESCHAQWTYGTLPDTDWEAMRRRLEIFLSLWPYRAAAAVNVFDDRFTALLDSMLASYSDYPRASALVSQPPPPSSGAPSSAPSPTHS